jgi:hypothetical protein
MDRPNIPKGVPNRLRTRFDDYLSTNGSQRYVFPIKGWRFADFQRSFRSGLMTLRFSCRRNACGF